MMPSNVSKTKIGDDDEVSDAGSSNVARDKLASSAHKLLRSMKQLLAREKTVNITGTGSSSCSSQIAGMRMKMHRVFLLVELNIQRLNNDRGFQIFFSYQAKEKRAALS